MNLSMERSPLRTAFVLGAGLGTRLRPLTNDWPKPLLPIGGRPTITYAFEQLKALGVQRVIINTHHRAERYDEIFPDGTWEGLELVFRHEPVLLETGGGIKNIEDLLDPEGPLLIYNGDIVSNLPLKKLLEAHNAAGNEVTLALRSAGGPLQIALGDDGRVADIGNKLGTDSEKLYLFSGVYMIERKFLDRLEAGKKESVIPTFLHMIRNGEGLGGVVIDDGEWTDIGTHEEYQRLNERAAREPDFAAAPA